MEDKKRCKRRSRRKGYYRKGMRDGRLITYSEEKKKKGREEVREWETRRERETEKERKREIN